MAMTSNWIPNIKKAWKGEEDFWKVFLWLGAILNVAIFSLFFVLEIKKIFSHSFLYFFSVYSLSILPLILKLNYRCRYNDKFLSKNVIKIMITVLGILSFVAVFLAMWISVAWISNSFFSENVGYVLFIFPLVQIILTSLIISNFCLENPKFYFKKIK